MGAGYPYIDQVLHDQYMWQILVVLGLAKILTTSLSFVSGTPGGMFAPTLFIGATIGGAVGALEHHFFPALSASVAPYALVGIGAFFAGFLRVPITSVFMVLETTGSYSIVLPVMITNTIAYLISRSYQDVPLFDMLAHQDGLELPSMEELREQVTLRVEDAVRKPTSPPLQGSNTISQALSIAEGYSDEIFLVSLPASRWASITKEELRQHAARSPEALLREVLHNVRIPILHPDQRLDDVLRFIHEYPLLPVVSRIGRKLEGTLSLDAILAAYQRAQ
jgi:CIC family chloride channel protein